MSRAATRPASLPQRRLATCETADWQSALRSAWARGGSSLLCARPVNLVAAPVKARSFSATNSPAASQRQLREVGSRKAACSKKNGARTMNRCANAPDVDCVGWTTLSILTLSGAAEGKAPSSRRSPKSGGTSKAGLWSVIGFAANGARKLEIRVFFFMVSALPTLPNAVNPPRRSSFSTGAIRACGTESRNLPIRAGFVRRKETRRSTHSPWCH